MVQTHIPFEQFKEELSLYTELSSVALGAKISSVSDEFFAEAFHLLKVESAPSLRGSFGPNGALYSGWETRRHNPNFDWCIIQLGAPGYLYGFDIDTSHFNGNEAPEASVQAFFSDATTPPTSSDGKWKQILSKVSLGPNSRHLFKVSPTNERYNYVKLNIYPDGGIARFRVYGLVATTFPASPSALVDLAHVFSGGRAVFTSDEHFGVGSNLLLPGRGKDMGDGWETKRSRESGHRDYAIIQLGHYGQLDHVEIDTNHFKGNYPASCELHACYSEEIVPTIKENGWTTILPTHKLGPHRRHFFQLENVAGRYFTHVRVTIYPDGGIKRVRVMGRREPVHAFTTQPNGRLNGSTQRIPILSSETTPVCNTTLDPIPDPQTSMPMTHESAKRSAGPRIPALPLTTEAFMPFGQVLMAWADPNAAPKGVVVTSANQKTAHKFHNLSQIDNSYPAEMNARTGFCLYRSTPAGAKFGEEWEVKVLERHPCTNQAFIPMGHSGGMQEDELPNAGRAYLVVVALNGNDDKPDLNTIKAFVATSSQGIVYNTGVWHHPMVTLETAIDFTCVETQVGGGDKLDCEVLSLADFPVVTVPDM